MQYLPNSESPWLTYSEFVPAVLTAENFRQAKVRGNLRVTYTGGTAGEIFIEFDSLKVKAHKDKVVEVYGDPKVYMAMEPLKALVVRDEAARAHYAEYTLPTGGPLPIEYQMKYARQCDWLNAISRVMANKTTYRKMWGISLDQFWESMTLLASKDKESPGLPTNVLCMRRKWKVYNTKGKTGLIEAHRWGNDFARKVTPKIEGLICSLYYQDHKPTMKDVCNEYNKFVAGLRDVVDITSGEVYDKKDFFIKGHPYRLGESTVDYYVKQPYNEAVMNKRRLKAQEYNTVYRPSVKRVAPFYAFSKITMDDILLPFDGPDGTRPAWSYQVFDVASTAVIGYAFARDKTADLMKEALRNMYRLIVRKGWGMPYEIEMEHHLNSSLFGKDNAEGVFEADIFTPGEIFIASRLCRGGNAQEKRAEGFIKQKKYRHQKKRAGFKGRFYAKLLTNRLNEDQKALRQQYEEIVQNELEDIADYNNDLHPRQDLYPGLTRWQVLEQYQNPNLVPHHAAAVMKHLGYSAATSIKAGRARVQYFDYVLPDMELMRSQTYNGELVAYYIPNDEGHIDSVHLYEDGVYLCEAKRLEGFQDAVIERTAADVPNMEQQWGNQKHYDRLIKEGQEGLMKVGVMSAGSEERRVMVMPVVAQAGPMEENYMPMQDAAARAWDDI